MKKIMVIALAALLGAGFVSTIPAQRASRGGEKGSTSSSSQLPNADVSAAAGYEYGYKFGSGNFTTGVKPTELAEEEWEIARRGGDPAKKDFSYSFSGAGTPGFGFRIARNAK